MDGNGKDAQGEVSNQTSDIHAQLEQARTAVIDVLLEIDHIELQINPRILSEYAVKIGCWEYELAKAQLTARRARRRVELAQAAVNEGRDFDESELETRLESELQVWKERVDEALRAYTQGMERRQGTRAMTPSEVKELKRLHRILIRRLHPDTHPFQSEENAHLFLLAQTAYEAGDIQALRSLEAATSSIEETTDENASEDELRAELALCQAHLSVLQESVDALKKANPYALADKLGDAQWVCDKVAALKAQIQELQEVKKAYDNRLEQLKGGA